MLSFTELPPLALYLHLPWCVRKCPYCDFNSHEARGEVPDDDYVAALLRDLEFELPGIWGRRLVSVFLGGGTPSLFSPEAIERLLSGLRAYLHLGPDAEVTLEANPGTVDSGRFAAFRQAGVNRLSIGVQSFRDAQLRALGRVHDGAAARRAVESARQAGFEDVNLDLMFGLPGDSMDGAMADLETAIALSPSHLSWYQLTLEPGTAFARRPPTLPDDERVADIHERGLARLAAAGFDRYEVSAFARPDAVCRHNINYWEFGDYLGLGAGAHGKISDRLQGRILRSRRTRSPAEYLRHAGSARAVSDTRPVPRRELGLEFMMNALRLVEGVPAALFQSRTTLPLSVVAGELEQAVERGWLEWTLQRIRPTEPGLRYLNEVLALFLPGEDGKG